MKFCTHFLVALCILFVSVSPCFAKAADEKAASEIKVAVEQHNKSLSEQDIKGVMTLYAATPNIVLMGTGPGEAYVGDEAIGSAYDQIFTKYEAKTLNFKYDWLCIGSSGNVAWFAVTTTIEGSLNKEKKERAFNMSGTLLKEKGAWRFASIHFSRLGAEQQAPSEQPK